MAEKQLMLPGEIVKISNSLARAPWGPSNVWEARLLANVASMVKNDDEDFKDYEIPLDSILGKSYGGNVYKAIDEATAKLMSTGVTLPKQHGKGFRKYHFFSYFEYTAPGKGVPGKLLCRFDKAMKPHFLDLKKHFKAWNMIEFLMLPTTYSQRIYMILRSWDDKAEKTITLAELREMLDLPKTYERYPDIRRRILDPAEKYINKFTSLYYKWEPIKKGRRIHSIRFVFSKPRRDEVAKKKQVEDKEKTRANNQKLALAAYNCYLANNCNYDENSKICQTCDKLKFRST